MVIKFLLVIAAVCVAAASPVFADHIQGEHLRPGSPVVQSEGEFFSGDKLTSLYKILLQADSDADKIVSLERTVAALQGEVDEFRSRKDLTEGQRKDFEALQKSYELHLQIYRDAVKTFQATNAELRETLKSVLEANKELAAQVKSLHRELLYTRAFSVLGILGLLFAPLFH